jgi:hypothetical protein
MLDCGNDCPSSIQGGIMLRPTIEKTGAERVIAAWMRACRLQTGDAHTFFFRSLDTPPGTGAENIYRWETRMVDDLTGVISGRIMREVLPIPGVLDGWQHTVASFRILKNGKIEFAPEFLIEAAKNVKITT